MASCPSCGHPNHDSAKFCEECAEPLTAPPVSPPTPADEPLIRCPSCDHPNDDSARFCEACAAPLVAPPETAPPGTAPPDTTPPDTTPTPAVATHPLVRCPSCGHPNEDSADFCEECATRLVVPAPATTPPRSGGLVLAWVTVGLAVLVLVLAGVAWWLTDDNGGGTDQAPTTTQESVPASATTAPASAPATTPSTARPDPAALPSGLFCRDLFARGYSYAEAVDYWNLEGQPSRMVAQDLPCQTVYPEDTVFAYWGLDSAGTPPGD